MKLGSVGKVGRFFDREILGEEVVRKTTMWALAGTSSFLFMWSAR